MNQLRLSLKRKWYEMTKAGIKLKDYRELNQYWCKRLTGEYICDCDGKKVSDDDVYDFIAHLGNTFFDFYDAKPFAQNIMTLGYPKNTDLSRILTLEHKGIEIGQGNPDWGAEEGKFYFIIKHGDIIQ